MMSHDPQAQLQAAREAAHARWQAQTAQQTGQPDAGGHDSEFTSSSVSALPVAALVSQNGGTSGHPNTADDAAVAQALQYQFNGVRGGDSDPSDADSGRRETLLRGAASPWGWNGVGSSVMTQRQILSASAAAPNGGNGGVAAPVGRVFDQSFSSMGGAVVQQQQAALLAQFQQQRAGQMEGGLWAPRSQSANPMTRQDVLSMLDSAPGYGLITLLLWMLVANTTPNFSSDYQDNPHGLIHNPDGFVWAMLAFTLLTAATAYSLNQSRRVHPLQKCNLNKQLAVPGVGAVATAGLLMATDAKWLSLSTSANLLNLVGITMLLVSLALMFTGSSDQAQQFGEHRLSW